MWVEVNSSFLWVLTLSKGKLDNVCWNRLYSSIQGTLGINSRWKGVWGKGHSNTESSKNSSVMSSTWTYPLSIAGLFLFCISGRIMVGLNGLWDSFLFWKFFGVFVEHSFCAKPFAGYWGDGKFKVMMLLLISQAGDQKRTELFSSSHFKMDVLGWWPSSIYKEYNGNLYFYWLEETSSSIHSFICSTVFFFNVCYL